MAAALSAPELDGCERASQLDEQGFVVLPRLLAPAQCAALRTIWDRPEHFRKRVIMERHAYGRGQYQYFAYPLPPSLAELRAELYTPLAAIANRWAELLQHEPKFPDSHAAFLERCRAAGQTLPTPLLLRYTPGDYNCLHQDLYGTHVFPLQIAILLSQPGEDFVGGEFVLTEQRPRAQSRASVVPLERGDAVVFPVHHRPVRGSRGWHRVNMRHGVSTVRSGERFTAGIIFHDAPGAATTGT